MFAVKDPQTGDKGPTAYERKKARSTRRERLQSKAGREISGDFEPVTDKKALATKRRILKSLKLFCKTIFPEVFYLPWSQDHPRIIGKLETAIRDGGQLAIAMPRGSGKSAIATAACLWAILNGHHEFVVLIAATSDAAVELLDGLRTQLETNDNLLKFFPEVCYPIRRLEGITQRRLLWHGELIRVTLTDKRIILPSYPASPAASAVIGVAGLTGRIRGMKFTRPDGSEVRPSLALLDDPQDDESARSETQCDYREKVTNGAVLGLCGPDRNMTAIGCVTVIVAGDYADRMLDRNRNPQWHGERTRLVDCWPTHPEAERLWAQYAEIRRNCMRNDWPTTEATEHYRANRKVMDAGAVLRWKERKGPDCLSALQHAFNFKIDRGNLAFDCEYQNNPPIAEASRTKTLEADALLTRLNNLPRGIIPPEGVKLTAFVDVQHTVLFWIAVAWDRHFGGAIIDYGTWPKQARLHFDLTNLTRTLQDELPNAGLEAQIFHGLKQLTRQILGREWPRDGGGAQSIEKCPIDANDGALTDLIYQFCRQSEFRSVVVPSHGHYSRTRSVGDWTAKPGDLAGPGWRSPVPSPKRVIRHVIYDTNMWKTHAYHRLTAPLGAPSAMTINGDRPEEHRLLAEHLTAEYATEVTRNERTADEWMDRPGRRNEWWDGITGNSVAASMLGVHLDEGRPTARKPYSSQPTRVNMVAPDGHRSFFVSDR